MKTLTVREVRDALSKIEKIIDEEGEIVVTRHGRPVARLLPAPSKKKFPSHADLRASMPYQEIGSEVLIRQDRDER